MPGADTLVATDQRHLIHPLHFAKDHATPKVYVSGQGAMLRTADGREYIDALSSLWNVNIGHGRRELAAAAAAQMEKLAYASAYAGFTNEPAIRLAEKHCQPRLRQHGGRLLHHQRRRIQRKRLQVRPLPLEAPRQARTR